MLAFLFDENAGHGQRQMFLKQFLNLIGHPDRQIGRSRVSTEYTLGRSGRKIDVLLRLGSHVIGIENKPWAGEQVEQCNDYADELERLAPGRWTLVFLTSDGRVPMSGGRHRLVIKTLQYNELADTLQTSCERLKPFLCSFKRYVKERINFDRSRDLNEAKMIDEFLRPENIGVVAEIVLRAEPIRHRLIEGFGNAMLARVQVDFSAEWIMQVLNLQAGKQSALDYKYSGLYFFKPAWKGKFAIGFSNQQGWGKDVIFGVYHWEHKLLTQIASGGLYRDLNDAFGKNGKCTQWWSWYLQMGGLDKLEYEDWYNIEVLNAIAASASAGQESTMVDNLYPMVRSTIQKAETYIDQELGRTLVT